MADEVRRFGKSDVLVAVGNLTSNGLVKVGEVQDMVDFSEQQFFHNVPGDRHGGPQGPPIEVQWLGRIVTINIDLSRWDPNVIDVLRNFNLQTVTWPPAAPIADVGKVDLGLVGSLMLLTRATRLCIKNSYLPAAGGSVVESGINFPCTLVRTPIGYNRGTKYTAYQMSFEAHRAPDDTNVFGTSAGNVYDATIADTIPAPGP